MKIAVRDRMLVNDAIIIFPSQQSRPTLALRVSDAANDFERRGQPGFLALAPARSLKNFDGKTFYVIHRKRWKGYESRAPILSVSGISELNYFCEGFANKVARHHFNPSSWIR